MVSNKVLQIKNSALNPLGLYNCYNVFHNVIGSLIFHIYNKGPLARASLIKAGAFNYNSLTRITIGVICRIGVYYNIIITLFGQYSLYTYVP